ncbi:group II intron reverse transcriptase/maturase [Desulfurivibrio alkaliphilus]|uniref:RNA-directed DNA polymerase n=1 Tax=Desulfurivibrio alkaliphilus (strain DSM 19089 / UNIQEM U267 / AHT2) TaxID=589865 RepID=D6Z063_DESAT|nr:RNA-directed DNA polymerase (Reverse transcriptase) [Desulfurivibrio alkaliphilus AHT 2]
MPRLCSYRSRSYPGRPARQAVQLTLDSVLHGNMPDDQAGVSRGHSSSATRNEGPNPEKGKGPASSAAATNPTGGAAARRVADQPDPDANLLERILSRANMLKAWERVKANKGAPGMDNMPIADFMAFAREHWEEIRASLLAGTYQPLPVKRVEIPKPTGGTRPLGIPTVLDRLIQQAMAQVLLPIFDPDFSEASYGFRPGRSAHDAIHRVRDYIRQGYRVAVDADLSKFFDTVDHDLLMNRVGRKVRDQRVLRLVGKYLRAGVMIDGRRRETRKGVPQGGPLSPLLSNILLDDLDKELERRGHRFARYADDFIILVKSRRAGERVMTGITRFLESKLKLVVNQEKSKVAPTNESGFLGFIFKGAKIRWSDKAFAEFKRRVKKLTGRSWGVSMAFRLAKLAEYLRGWMGYFGISEYYRPLPEIDHWLRRRVRMCHLKQWRRCRTKVRELTRLGCNLRLAISIGLSRKGPYRLAKTLATQSGMTNQWLKDQGLLSVKELWVNIHYPATAR